jgi:hypothetical protein
MLNLQRALNEFLQQEDWDFQFVESVGICRMSFSGDTGSWACLAQARELHQQVVFYSICPLRVPEPRRQPMSEFLTRANYGIVVGNFEMDFDDGEVRYKTSLDLEDVTEPSVLPAMLSHLVYANVTAMDHYLPGILAVLAGSKTPTEAAAEIDESSEPDLTKS